MEIGPHPVGTIFKGRAMDLFGKFLLARRILRCSVLRVGCNPHSHLSTQWGI